MKIILAIVDELPKSASECQAVESCHELSGRQEYLMNVYCSLDFGYRTPKVVTPHEYCTRRCPNCPLVEEAEEVQG